VPHHAVEAEVAAFCSKQKNRSTQKSGCQTFVAQGYIQSPLLVDGRKFDLRLYVLVTSFGEEGVPPEVYLFREGFARFASEPFSVAPEDLQNRYIHLTNNCINKKNVPGGEAGLENWTLARLESWMAKEAIDFGSLWQAIRDLVATAIAAAVPTISEAMACVREERPSLMPFELFGFDVMIDEKLHPWLLEVNSRPALGGALKLPKMVEDVFRIISRVSASPEGKHHFGGQVHSLVPNEDVCQADGGGGTANAFERVQIMSGPCSRFS